MATTFTLKRKLFAFGIQNFQQAFRGVTKAGEALTGVQRGGAFAKGTAGMVGGVAAVGAAGAGIAAKKVDDAANGM